VLPRRLAPALAIAALALIPAGARAVTPSAYATNSASPGGISEFDIGSDGFLASKGVGAGAGSSTQDMAITADGRFAYAVAGNSIYPFGVDSAGRLNGLGSPVTAGSDMSAVAVSPDGQHLYATDRGSDAVYQYSIASDGRLFPKLVPTLATGTDPVSVAVSPDGNSVYVVNATSHDLYRYAASGGSLQAGPQVLPAGTTPSTVAVPPDGRAVWVTDRGGGGVLEYTVGGGGALGPNPPPSVPSGAAPTGIAVSPDGKSVYVSNSGDGTVAQFNAGPGAGLAAKTSPIGLPGGAMPQRLAVAPSGARLYVPDSASGHNVVYGLAIGPGGAIVGGSGHFASAGAAPGSVTVLPNQGPLAAFGAAPGVAGSPTALDGRASSDTDGTVTHFDWDFGDGTAAVDAGPTPSHVYAQPGRYSVTLSVSDDGGCSTARVFTGRTALCNGGAGAVITQPVDVPAVPPPGAKVVFAGMAAHSQTVRVDRHGLARISVRCPRGTFGSCIGTLALVTKGKVRVPRRHGRSPAKKLLVGQAGFNIQSAKAVRIPIQISSAGRKVLARRRVLKTTATINAHDRAFNVHKTAFSVALKPAKRPKRRR
jgi:DNA-binding beta-propeller fold protein YncE